MPIYRVNGLEPSVHPDAFIFETAVVIGNVRIAADASLWSHVTVRGDNALIDIGAGTNIQESSVLHVDDGFPLTIGEHVTVGHQAMLHGCTIESGALIGMQAIVLNGARIGRNCLIGAGAIVPEGREIPDNSLVIGIGKIVRTLGDDEIATIRRNNLGYVERARSYRNTLERIG